MKRGALRAMAIREGGTLPDGRIDPKWARRKLRAPGTHKKTRARLQFYLNMNPRK